MCFEHVYIKNTRRKNDSKSLLSDLPFYIYDSKRHVHVAINLSTLVEVFFMCCYITVGCCNLCIVTEQCLKFK